MEGRKITMYTDGCAEPNPGRMGLGVVFLEDGEVVKVLSEYAGHGTNNVAEYQAVILGLEYALEQKWLIGEIYSDSKLVLNQVSGEWTVNKANLQQARERILELLPQLGSPELHWVASENNIADAPSREAIVGVNVRYGRLHPVKKTRKDFTCRICGDVIPAGSGCFKQNEYTGETQYGKETRVCEACGSEASQVPEVSP